MTIPQRTLGQELRRYRQLAGLSQLELARRAGIAQASVSRAECDLRPPAPELADRLKMLCIAEIGRIYRELGQELMEVSV